MRAIAFNLIVCLLKQKVVRPIIKKIKIILLENSNIITEKQAKD